MRETFPMQMELFCIMGTTKKIAIGLGVASGALLAAWLLTGDRKKKTTDFISKRADELKNSFNKQSSNQPKDESDIHYV